MKNSKNKFLEFLKNHSLVKWIFFLSAFIGAGISLVSIPISIYRYIGDRVSFNKVEYEKIESLKTGVSLKYIESIFGEPTFERKCQKLDSLNYDIYFNTECLLPEVANYRHTFETENYYLQIVTDDNEAVLAYTIYIKNKFFNPKIKLFLGRFVGDFELKLGVTRFSKVKDIEGDGFIRIFEEPLLGNNFGGFIQLIYSEDYAVNQFIVLEASSWASWSDLYNGITCSYGLLNKFDEKYDQLNEREFDLNLNLFKKNCPIQSITIADPYLIGESFLKLNQLQKEEFLREQMQFFSIQ